MQIELWLKPFLEQHGLLYHGAIKEMAEECGAHRHTITKILDKEMANPSFDVISGICRWILAKKKNTDFDPSTLPAALFRVRPAELLLGLGRSELVTIYLGEYKQAREDMPNIPAHRSIARRDAEVESMLIRILSSPSTMGEYRPLVHTRFLPFSYTWNNPCPAECEFDNDIKLARAIFEEDIKDRNPKESVILVGSQRVNFLVECLVADLYRCQAFTPLAETPKIPFYLAYRDFDRAVRSCFGGTDFPPKFREQGWNREEYEAARQALLKQKGRKSDIPPAVPGTYYLTSKDGPWQFCPWEPEKADAGIVIIIRNNERFTVAIFGFSGSSTVAVGRDLLEFPQRYWPEVLVVSEEKKKGRGRKRKKEVKASPQLTTTWKGLEIGTFLCRVKFSPKSRTRKHRDRLGSEKFTTSVEEVIPLPFPN